MTLPRVGGSRQANRIARRLAAFIPRTLTGRLLRGEKLAPGQERRLEAAVLFLDISGFSAMANELAADGPRGAEELNRLLLMTFTAMINAIHSAGGFVSHFHGDGLMVCFEDDDGQCARRALACAQFMQNLMGGAYSRMLANRPDNQTTIFDLSMKIGVGYGRCLEIVVGQPQQGMEYVLAGPAVDEAVAAEGRAQATEVIASRAVLTQAGLPAIAPYQPLRTPLPVPFTQSSLHWEAYATGQLWDLATAAAEFVPRPLWERLGEGNDNFIAEHRPVTSMFVRFEGIDYDDSDAAEKLQSYYLWAQKIVASFGSGNSHINRVLTGDKGSLLHIIFGAPVAPDSPEQALRCALALQRERPNFVVRQQIGVAAGLAFACAVGSHNRREYTIVGDVVNLSARLMSRCQDGQVLLDGLTAARVQDMVDLASVGMASLKGFTRPIAILEVVGAQLSSPGAQSRYDQVKTPLLGREGEQAQLRAALDAALARRSGAAVVVGSSTKEQTHLVSIGVDYWQQQGGDILAGVGQEHLTDLPFGLWQGICRALFDLADDDSAAVQAEQVERVLMTSCPTKLGDLPLLEPLLAIPLPLRRESLIGLGTVEKQARLFDLLLKCLQTAARRRPLLIVLENIHWSDQASRALFHHLANHSGSESIFYLATCSASAGGVLAQLPPVKRIELADVSLRVGRQLVQQMLDDRTIPAGLYEHLGLHKESGQVNPHLLVDNINRLLANQALQVTKGVALDPTLLAEQTLSGDLHSIYLAQLDRLSPTGRNFLQSASILGREFDLNTLTQTIVNLPTEATADIVAELTRADLIRSLPRGGKFIFQDEIVQEAAYQSIPYGRRQRWHATVADWLAEQAGSRPALFPMAAFHYSRTDLHERAIEYALLAGESARSTTPRTAVQLYTLGEQHLRAAGLDKHWREGLALYGARAELLWISEMYDAAAVDAALAEKLAVTHQRHDILARMENLRGRIALRQGQPGTTLNRADFVCSRLRESIPAPLAGQALANRAAAHFYQGAVEPALTALAAADEIFERYDDRIGRSRTLLLRAQSWLIPREEWEAAAETLAAAQKLVPHTGEYSIENLIRLLIGKAQIALHEEQDGGARELLDQAQDVSTENGLRWWLPAIFRHRAALAGRASLPAQANTLLEQGVQAVEQGGNPDELPLLYLDLARIMPNSVLRRPLLDRCRDTLATRSRAFDRLTCETALGELAVS